MDKKALSKIFGLPELIEVIKKWRLLLFIITAISISFWGLGFSKGARLYLKEKMDSPFVNYIPLKLQGSYARDFDFKDKLNSLFQEDSIIEYYSVKNSFFLYGGFFNLKTRDSSNSISVKVLPLSGNNSLYTYLLSSESIKLTKRIQPFSEGVVSVVITEDLLHRLGYRNLDYPAYINYEYSSVQKSFLAAPLAVAGVVSQLPFESDLLVTEEFKNVLRTDSWYLDVNGREHLQYISFWVQESRLPDLDQLTFPYEIDENYETYLPGKMVTFFVDSKYHQDVIEEISKVLGDGFHRRYDYYAKSYKEPSIGTPDYFVLELESEAIERVSELNDFLANKFANFSIDGESEIDLQVDLNTVESRKNYDIFNTISLALGSLLSFFAVLFITYVTTRLVLEHIERNAKNLGTLKAFGLSNITISIIYSTISTIVVALIVLLSFAFSQILVLIINPNMFGITSIPHFDMESAFRFQLDIINFFIFLILPVVLSTIVIYLGLRGKTPGDLIYER